CMRVGAAISYPFDYW
nr:immunoglobulin heavy chain junction region [Macaca mulatta]MOW24411.1 immunoglobulin heavy chain junction region [Macaca mulatta]MOW24976.1 immunoglobulin heavy chain junction region [Macaca mulatta]MOW25371.1 immunoglobulin heavy chain junction region [Macaca mulatta]MOW25480.1 immunoglobulin heavy chain junction region [Macaca mulatta]